MRFTGQVRVPEVDHPGVPAVFVVEDDQAEVLLEGESLGRWSLFDVHASRLVSAAFSVSLAGDEITFIADEPMDFAYKGVDHMAESWASFKAMTFPRRMVAVGRSRRGTIPSRVTELRDAMLANLEAQSVADWAEDVEGPTAAPALAAAPTPVAPPVEVPTPPIQEWSGPIPPPVEQIEEVLPVVEEAPVVEELEAPPIAVIPLRPGPGLIARPPTAPPPPPPITEVEPTEVFRPEPVELAPVELAPVELEPVGTLEPAAALEPVELEPVEAVEPAVTLEPVELEPVGTVEPAALEPVELKPEPEVPELVSELLSTSTEDDRDATAKGLVVDLGAYEVARAPDPEPAAPTTKAPAPALAATAPVADRSGIFGAVRAAFVRNKGSHLHEFVEAPGGLGITRLICSECGYISLGISDTDSE
ncbi:MAG TPA: hypothetical protein VI980_05365 [Acidimicrobiia bacterium]|nr:hypothetical protein [Acidimicrobiia bacterium]